MHLNSGHTSTVITELTGIRFEERQGLDESGPWIEVFPAAHDRASAFVIRTTIGWRHLDIRFLPGAFSKALLAAMRKSSPDAKRLFCDLVHVCERFGAIVTLRIGGRQFEVGDEDLWLTKWSNVSFRFRVGQLEFEEGDASTYNSIVPLWVGRVVAAVSSLIPTSPLEQDIRGFSEGAVLRLQANRYERDPRNRAAALAIHGYSCAACNTLLSHTYGGIGEGFIEVHHRTPVSELGEGYVISPITDLIPLCPNCHAITHRRNPPLTLDELRALLNK